MSSETIEARERNLRELKAKATGPIATAMFISALRNDALAIIDHYRAELAALRKTALEVADDLGKWPVFEEHLLRCAADLRSAAQGTGKP